MVTCRFRTVENPGGTQAIHKSIVPTEHCYRLEIIPGTWRPILLRWFVVVGGPVVRWSGESFYCLHCDDVAAGMKLKQRGGYTAEQAALDL